MKRKTLHISKLIERLLSSELTEQTLGRYQRKQETASHRSQLYSDRLRPWRVHLSCILIVSHGRVAIHRLAPIYAVPSYFAVTVKSLRSGVATDEFPTNTSNFPGSIFQLADVTS